MAVIGKGPSSETIDATKKLTLQRKKEEKLRLSVLTSFNQNVLLSDSITVERHDSTVENTQSTEGQAEDHESTNDQGKVHYTETDAAAKDHRSGTDKDKVNYSETVTKDHESTPESVTEPDIESTIHNVEHCSKQTQTSKLHMLCLCDKCQNVVADFIQIVMHGSSKQCDSKQLHQPPPTPNISRTLSGEEVS
ncbi:hypothetical protein ONE63_011329 [Megalurothrips usitatus]|uniref:Uncharacterized protein n=1 Tax=Megalurothrips usitatus TaxID=439358 RepID=A0AAV7X3F3_9NEOP|nr:hypothetical protein ONE63_011329 [Megalurothrips usitatus]